MFTDFIFQIDLAQVCRSVGVLGFMLYMASFAALQLEWIDGYGLTYSFANVLAASLVLISLSADFNLASALIQISWIAIGTVGISIRLIERRKARRAANVTWIAAE